MKPKFGSTMRKYDFFEDPGHGWLKVDVRELDRLGIADKISNASYMQKGYAFLEEDCDLPIFLQAKLRIDKIKIEFREHVCKTRESTIRRHSPYCYGVEV